jgi:hypothetical protein
MLKTLILAATAAITTGVASPAKADGHYVVKTWSEGPPTVQQITSDGDPICHLKILGRVNVLLISQNAEGRLLGLVINETNPWTDRDEAAKTKMVTLATMTVDGGPPNTFRADALNGIGGRTRYFSFPIDRDFLRVLKTGKLLDIAGPLGGRFGLTGAATAIAALDRCGDAIETKVR